MSLIKQVQQLGQDGVPIKEIARRTAISRKTVKKIPAPAGNIIAAC